MAGSLVGVRRPKASDALHRALSVCGADEGGQSEQRRAGRAIRTLVRARLMEGMPGDAFAKLMERDAPTPRPRELTTTEAQQDGRLKEASQLPEALRPKIW